MIPHDYYFVVSPRQYYSCDSKTLMMISVGELLLSALASAAAFRLCTFFYHKLTCPLRHLPGPKGTSLIYGNLLDVWRGVCHRLSRVYSPDSVSPFVQDNLNVMVQELWVKEYGKTLKFKGVLSVYIWPPDSSPGRLTVVTSRQTGCSLWTRVLSITSSPTPTTMRSPPTLDMLCPSSLVEVSSSVVHL
jgi:hypothetical protein